MSPGFGGAAALAAAGLAFLAAHRTTRSQLAIESEKRRHELMVERERQHQEHKIAEQKRSWEMFQWAVENQDLDPFVLIAFVRHLKEQAKRLDDTTLLKLLEEYTRGGIRFVRGTTP